LKWVEGGQSGEEDKGRAEEEEGGVGVDGEEGVLRSSQNYHFYEVMALLISN
jgi:hypothetical protein